MAPSYTATVPEPLPLVKLVPLLDVTFARCHTCEKVPCQLSVWHLFFRHWLARVGVRRRPDGPLFSFCVVQALRGPADSGCTLLQLLRLTGVHTTCSRNFSKTTTCWRNPHPVHFKSLGVCHGRGHLQTCSGASWGRRSGVWTSRSFFATVQDASVCVHI